MQGPLFTEGQYDMLTADKPERQRKPRPEKEIVESLRYVFGQHTSDRLLYTAARKLYNSCGLELAVRGLERLSNLPGWSYMIRLNKVSVMTQVSRIEQAAATGDDQYQREAVEIALEMGRRQSRLDGSEKCLILFLQEVHTAHPIMRKQIKAAAEMVVKAAFQLDKEKGVALIPSAVEIAKRDKNKVKWLMENYRPPKETAQWIVQILARSQTKL